MVGEIEDKLKPLESLSMHYALRGLQGTLVERTETTFIILIAILTHQSQGDDGWMGHFGF